MYAIPATHRTSKINLLSLYLGIMIMMCRIISFCLAITIILEMINFHSRSECIGTFASFSMTSIPSSLVCIWHLHGVTVPASTTRYANLL
ncbi:hypothetical protein F5Y02DRAFT_395947 [Annulohypoxylon stygium]|nr:hypothetical protein F5Y02DRAFT_395947 [Annulohypoxylon stygium]